MKIKLNNSLHRVGLHSSLRTPPPPPANSRSRRPSLFVAAVAFAILSATTSVAASDVPRPDGTPPIATASSEVLVQGTSGGEAGWAYDDIAGNTHANSIQFLADELDIFSGTECGDNSFCPTRALKRWEMAVWLIRSLGETPARSSSLFDDVSASEWWAPYVERMYQLGITVGCERGLNLRYCPDRLVTRGEMASFLVRAFDLPLVEGVWFSDTSNSVHNDNINALRYSGITKGCGPYVFCPNRSVTRGEMATFIFRKIGPSIAPNSGSSVGEPCGPNLESEPNEPAISLVFKIEGCYEIEYELIGNRDPEQALADAQRRHQHRQGFQYAELPPEPISPTDYSEPTHGNADPELTSQWHLQDNRWTTFFNLGVQSLWEGWDNEVAVLVIDNGIDLNHSDLQGFNPGGTQTVKNPDTGRTEYCSHGTHVAGIVAAHTNNGELVASVAPDAKIISGGRPSFDCKKIIRDIQHSTIADAKANNDDLLAQIRVVNLSLGKSSSTDQCDSSGWGKFTSNIRSLGVVVVASTGNDANKTNDPNDFKHHYPASCANVIGVGATDEKGIRAPFSNYGTYVDLVAPGVNILSLFPSDSSHNTGRYDGTSQATPIVSGIVSHLFSRYPSATPEQVETALFMTARRKSTSDDETVDLCGKRNDKYGYGFPNPLGALDFLDSLVNKTQYGEYGYFEDESCQEKDPDEVPEPEPTPEPKERSVRLRVGVSAQGQDNCSVVHCKWFDIDLEGDGWDRTERYSVDCYHNGIANLYPAGRFGTGSGYAGDPNSLNRLCYFGFPGEGVYVEVDGERSNVVTWPEESPLTPPERPSLSVSRGGLGVAGGCTSSSGCRWIHGSGSGWTPGAQFWIKCGDFVDTSRNKPVVYAKRYVDSSGNLSWGDRICLSNFEHTVEVWTISDDPVRITVSAPGSEGPTPDLDPELSVSRGGLGVAGGCTSSSGCRWVHGSGSGWTPGAQFWVKCGDFVDTSRNKPVVYAKRYVDSSGNLSWGDRICLSNFEHTVEVWTNADGTVRETVPATEGPTPDLDPELSVSRGGLGVAGGCTSSSGCRWVHGSGSGWTPGAQFWVKCGDFVDTSRNKPVVYAKRYVDSSGNLSWGDRICLSNFEHTVEVWTNADGTVRVTAEYEDEGGVPGVPVVNAVPRGKGISASWSADDNGSPIDRWEVGGLGERAASFTSHLWPSQDPGTYHILVRARNEHGWGEWGSDIVIIEEEEDDDPPELSVSRGGLGVAGGCASSSGCRWVHGSGSGWTPGAQFWVKCGDFVDTSRNKPVVYAKRYVDSSGNLSWGDRICLSNFEHTVEVWTNADGTVRVTVPAP